MEHFLTSWRHKYQVWIKLSQLELVILARTCFGDFKMNYASKKTQYNSPSSGWFLGHNEWAIHTPIFVSPTIGPFPCVSFLTPQQCHRTARSPTFLLKVYRVSPAKQKLTYRKYSISVHSMVFSTTYVHLCQSPDSPGNDGKDPTEVIRRLLHLWKRPDTDNIASIKCWLDISRGAGTRCTAFGAQP